MRTSSNVSRLSYLLGVIGRSGLDREESGWERLMGRAGPDDTILSLVAGGSQGHFLLSPAASVARTNGDQATTVVFHGELYPDATSSSAEYCLQAYLRQGMGFVSELHGSFVLAVIDQAQQKIRFATDPVNSRQLFFGEHDGLAWFSTMHAFRWHPCSGNPDPGGIAHYLVNGVPMNGRTLFDGVRVLERASIHEIQGTRVASQPYWRYEPNPESDTTAESLGGDLRDALLAAVERRLPSEGEVRLSLSGGYDSTAVLGAFGLMHVPDVGCFTYRKPAESDRSDASVARQMAAVAGYAHTELQAYGDDIGTVVSENIRRGQGMTRLVVETDAWRALRGLRPADRRSTFWVADECFGVYPARTLHDHADVLNSLDFADWSSLGSLGALFPRSVSAVFRAALRADLDSLIDRNQAIDDPYVLRDCLYLDQRLPRLLSWREAFAESCGEVRNPLIDRSILELRQRFPIELALGKSLFKDTVEELFPDLFAIDRAVAGVWFAGQWARDQLRDHPDELERMVRDSPSSPFDSYLPPEALLRVITSQAGVGNALRRATRRRGRILSRVLRKVRTSQPPPIPQRRYLDTAAFALRAVTLRELFRQRSAN
jgi:asparagine synthetase B (glutamine-hydrolysing)